MSEKNTPYVTGLPGFFEIPVDLREKGTVLYAVDKNGFTKLKTSCAQICLQGQGQRSFNTGLDDFVSDFTTRADKEGIKAILAMDPEANAAMANLGLFEGETQFVGNANDQRKLRVYRL